MDSPLQPIRVLAVDDHPLLREGVAAVIANQSDMMLAGEAVDGIEAVDQFRSLLPDVTLMDIQMPNLGGIEAIRMIREQFPAARIIVLTTYRGDLQALRAIKAGAVGYLLKGMLRKELVETIRSVHAGRKRIPPEIAADMAEHAADDPITSRELDVLRCVAQGNANRTVASTLCITEETVKAHMKSILSKLAARDRTHAVVIALRRGLIEL